MRSDSATMGLAALVIAAGCTAPASIPAAGTRGATADAFGLEDPGRIAPGALRP